MNRTFCMTQLANILGPHRAQNGVRAGTLPRLLFELTGNPWRTLWSRALLDKASEPRGRLLAPPTVSALGWHRRRGYAHAQQVRIHSHGQPLCGATQMLTCATEKVPEAELMYANRVLECSYLEVPQRHTRRVPVWASQSPAEAYGGARHDAGSKLVPCRARSCADRCKDCRL
jgi:hypothetical protein